MFPCVTSGDKRRGWYVLQSIGAFRPGARKSNASTAAPSHERPRERYVRWTVLWKELPALGPLEKVTVPLPLQVADSGGCTFQRYRPAQVTAPLLSLIVQSIC